MREEARQTRQAWRDLPAINEAGMIGNNENINIECWLYDLRIRKQNFTLNFSDQSIIE